MKSVRKSVIKIRGHGITKIYGNSTGNDAKPPAVNQVSFEVHQGEVFVIMGLSGSGKSTLLRMLNWLVEPTEGEIFIDGESLGEVSEARMRQLRNETINMVFQHFAIFPHRTVIDNASYGLRVRGINKKERRTRAMEALETVGLADWANRFPSDLSGGMRQRVGLARALATDSEVLLMDEPFSALDPLIRREMQDLLLRLQKDLQKTVVFVTHDLNEAMKIGDRIMVMRDGGVVQLGSVEEILNHPADDYVAEFISDVDRSRVITAGSLAPPPVATATRSESPRDVLARMKLAELQALYVLDENQQLAGLATVENLEEGLFKGYSTLHGLLSQDFCVVSEDTKLMDLFDQVERHPVPIAVTTTTGVLRGVLSRQLLMDTLANRKETADA